MGFDSKKIQDVNYIIEFTQCSPVGMTILFMHILSDSIIALLMENQNYSSQLDLSQLS